MDHIEIGDIIVATDGNSLTLRRRGEPDVQLRLDAAGVGELLDFMRSIRLSEVNRRRGFRVPVVTPRLNVTLAGAFGSVTAHPRDLSLSGIFVEFADADMPTLEVGDEVEVSVALDEDRCTMSGAVSRLEESGYAIVFGHAADSSHPSPPAPFARIVMQLESEWLAARLK